MYLGSIDQQALHRLLCLAVEGLLWHYQYLELSPSQMTILLETDGSATVTGGAGQGATASLSQSAHLLGEEVSKMWVEQARPFLSQRGVNSCSELCVVNALSAYFHAAARGPENHWHALLFEQGVLTHDQDRAFSSNENGDLWLRLWPDFTLLESGTFDYGSTLEGMKSLAESDPSLTITVIDVRPQTTSLPLSPQSRELEITPHAGP
jgi:hypothetical protein